MLLIVINHRDNNKIDNIRTDIFEKYYVQILCNLNCKILYKYAALGFSRIFTDSCLI